MHFYERVKLLKVLGTEPHGQVPVNIPRYAVIHRKAGAPFTPSIGIVYNNKTPAPKIYGDLSPIPLHY